MSIETWKKEFYPEPAWAAAKKGTLAACEHSYRKWVGLYKKNLKKHGLEKRFDCVEEINGSGAFIVDSDTCSLCCRLSASNSQECGSCPLFRVRGVACDMPKDEETIAPYDAFLQHSDPEPMIRWLRKAVAFCKQAKAQKRKKAQ